DSVPGVRAGVAAGMRVFGFTGGDHCDETQASRLGEAGADLVFDDMALLPDLLDGAGRGA
ncbi:MAG: hydrolase, partial [Geminicoccales bacterium]